MCYDDQAQPPIPPGDGGAAHGADGVLTSSDGTQFAAYTATPVQPSGAAAVLIYPDVRGLHQFYKDLALRFAEAGVPAVAIDYFGRTAGLTSRAASFEFMPHVQQVRMDTFGADVQTALGSMHAQFGDDTPIYVVGFCMGGTLALLTGTDRAFGFAGLVPFYAGLSRDFGGAGTVLDNADKVRYPVLGLFGGADAGIPIDEVEQLDQRLDATGVAHEIVVYPDAPHSFFDRRATEFAAASADAWQRILGFVQGTAA